MKTAEAILNDLLDTIEATGGMAPVDRGGWQGPAVDPEWTDLGSVVLNAERLLGRRVTRQEDEE